MIQRGLIATVLSAGIFIGATGLLLILKIIQERKRKASSQNLERLDLTVAELQEELLSIKRNSALSGSRLSLRSNSSRSSRLKRNGFDTDDEMFSALGSETEEFYDITSDDEEFSSRPYIEKSCANDEYSPNLFEEVDILLKGNDQDRLNALTLLEEEEMEQEGHCKENVGFMWRMAKAHQMQATAWGARNDSEKKKYHVLQGLSYAEKALIVDPSNPDAHKWYAILVGMQGEFLSVKEKIQNGYTFQKHLQEALESKPNDSSLHHLLGRFKYEVANLSWVEKKMAATLFAALPPVTMEDALSDFQKAEDLNPVPWKENRLFIAKCHIGSGNYVEAVNWLNATKEINPATRDDQVCDEECELLLSKYERYGNRLNKSF